jgi:subtilisin-like proprotein convertase family protein
MATVVCRVAGVLGLLLMMAGPAQADWNRTPIAVPLVNADAPGPSPGSPFPSSLTIVSPGGPTAVSTYIEVRLHAVTHPCPEDLAVLLVHGADKYLLMSNAGGCRPLQGTDIVFTDAVPPATVLPDNEVSTTPHGEQLSIRPSNYGVPPVFPGPAPSGPYATTLPNRSHPTNGVWSLYVVDVHAANRGVIAGGWSLNYDPYFTDGFSYTAAFAPAIPDVGQADVYPIEIDLTDVPPTTLVRDVNLTLSLSHGYADDLRIVLQSPGGTTVALMANAGGSSVLDHVSLQFHDGAPSFIPDAGPLPVDSFQYYKPSVYDLPLGPMPGPAPPGPYGAALSAFFGEHAAGVWRLWIADDTAPDGGAVHSVALSITPDLRPSTFSLDSPTSAPDYTTNQPFLHVEGFMVDVEPPISVTWRNVVDGAFYAAGGMEVFPNDATSLVVAGDVPMKKGTNVLTVRVTTIGGPQYTDTLTVTVNEFTYSLSEGATSGFFDEEVTMGNPTGVAAPLAIDFLQEGAAPIAHADSAPANAPLQLRVNDLVPPGAVSTVVHSLNAVPLAVERTMSWNDSGYGGHGGTPASPHRRWLFAEGSQGYFDTFLLLANDTAGAVSVTVRFLLESGGVVNHPVTVPAHTRLTIYAGDIPALRFQSFGIDIVSSAPIVAERSMYFPHNGTRLWEGGHEAAGANRASTRWFLAEGATGQFFASFILLSNPQSRPANATLMFLLPSGETVTTPVTIPANGRLTRNIADVDPRLANGAVSTIVTADVGIIVERSMYWPNNAGGWREAHNSVGVTDAALRWGVSDIRVGGTRAYQTFILLANPNGTPAEVQVRLLRSDGTPIVRQYTLTPTSRTNIVPADFGASAGTYSMDVHVLNYQPIVVEKAMYWNAGGEIWAAGTGVVATPLPPP